MYLFRATNCTYYSRFCVTSLGFPADVKVSLLTKQRSDAIERNLILVSALRPVVVGFSPTAAL